MAVKEIDIFREYLSSKNLGGVRLNGGAVKLGNNLVGGNMVGLPSSIYGYHHSRLTPSQIDQKQYTV